MGVSVLCFVANVLLIRALGAGGSDVWVTTALRFAAGLALCVALQRRSLDVAALFTRPRLILRGLIGGAATYGLYLAVSHSGAGRAVFLNNTYVILASLLAVWLLRERFRPALAVGAVVALTGLALLTGFAGGSWRGDGYDLVALASAAAAGWVVVAIRQLHREGVPTATIFASQCVYGLALCAPFLLARSEPPAGGAGAGLVAAGVLAGIGQLSMTSAFRVLTVAEGTLIQMLVPLGIAAGGIVLFAEPLGWADIGGGALIVAGSILPSLAQARAASPAR